MYYIYVLYNAYIYICIYIYIYNVLSNIYGFSKFGYVFEGKYILETFDIYNRFEMQSCCSKMV